MAKFIWLKEKETDQMQERDYTERFLRCLIKVNPNATTALSKSDLPAGMIQQPLFSLKGVTQEWFTWKGQRPGTPNTITSLHNITPARYGSRPI